jgi:L,D-transpeptidase YcbB
MLRPLAAALAALSLLAACQAPRTEPVAGRWTEAALDDLAAAAAGVTAHGLPPETAALNELGTLREGARTDEQARAVLDQLADELFSRLAHVYAQGMVDPALDPAWRISRAGPAETEALLAARAGGGSASLLLQELLPQDAQYAGLVRALAEVTAEPEGALGPNEISQEQRLASLRVSLERWRWLPRDLGNPRVEVRIPHFEAVYRGPEGEQRHRVIVGALATQTPSFAAQIEAVTVNPTWTVPRSILSDELLPRYRRNPSAVGAEGYDILDSRGRAVDPDSVDWNAHSFPYTLRQRAGAANALGRIKFEMPNPYDAFLHDTPNRTLFARDVRALSHGCVRVENPVRLAAVLAPDRDAAAFEAAIEAGATRRMPLATAVPVYALYITAVADTDGTVRYADDLYERDASILAALEAPDAQLAASAVRTPGTECSG